MNVTISVLVNDKEIREAEKLDKLIGAPIPEEKFMWLKNAGITEAGLQSVLTWYVREEQIIIYFDNGNLSIECRYTEELHRKLSSL